LGWILEGEEEADLGTFPSREGGNVTIIDDNFSGRRDIIGVTGDSFSEGAFSGAIFAHDGANFADREGEGEVIEDTFLVKGEGEVRKFGCNHDIKVKKGNDGQYYFFFKKKLDTTKRVT
jgi:hypothetical protein